MKVEITNRQKNALLNREEMEFSVDDSALTPSRKELKEKIAALVNAKTELVIIGTIEKEFGSKAVKGVARIYSDEKTLKKTELPQIIGRNIGQKDKGKKAGKAKATKAAEATAEKAVAKAGKAAEAAPAQAKPAEKK